VLILPAKLGILGITILRTRKNLMLTQKHSSKVNLDDLAIFGGNSSFPEPLHVGRPNIGNRENLLERINDLLDRKWLSNNGRYVQEFENRLAELLP
jgi:hypothetical protein